MSLFKADVIGRLTRDVERPNANGPYKLTLAVDNAVRKGKARETKFVSVDVWPGSTAGAFIERLQAKGHTLSKGSLVSVRGEISWEVYNKTDGSGEAQREVINASEIDFIPVGKGGTAEGGQGGQAASGGQQPAQTAAAAPGGLHLAGVGEDDDDIPL